MKEMKLPEGWKVEKLDTLFLDKFTGDWGSSDEENKGIFVIRTTNFTNNGKLNLDGVVTRCIDNKVIKRKKLQFGDIILEKSGGSDNQPVGRVIYFDKTDGIYICNNFTHVLRVNKKKAVPKYVMYFLLDVHKKGITKYFQNKTTGIRNLQMKRYLGLDIVLPPQEIQKKIVKALEKAEEILKKRKEVINLLDELVKSRFIEMFEEPKKNDRGWEVAELGKYLNVLTDYHSNGSYETLRDNVTLLDTPDYALMVRTTDLENHNFEKDVKYIDEHAYNHLKKSKVFGGEIIINKIGSAGKIYLMPFLNRPVSLAMNQFLLRFDENKVNHVFIYNLLLTPYMKVKIKEKVRGAVTKTITKDAIREIKIMVPPIQLQNQFADFVKQVDKLKFEMQKSLKKMENNFNSLIQRAFKGELFK
ncbi:MAG: restriction endonuclease subunit S [Clostridium tyrobutyricum]|jgi:type I restriction enzyme S subunit|uniref:restriction endonuclease subunit S n=1 Tax=Clostridium tyrobutyricum TaxID=1519 RepID=UPI00242CBEE2|nr:restriction endonuclease subunit S [Clostridium tyrobutyricum]MCH4198881.1 restriction endonuclease subunit S [Clostridium tyrobutyricum]MCH4236409.1 restriction endonuclease subunit S [Clostridium tyrobutyricum]MCH4258270.1 restriction endonuclease subunit S [Clostridium tyrobutyricum]MCI1239439.1 restriction endonuclease subunit S [Clostridium tyrobutyricum]MCI1653152.1 restriction endonuclease subunit S [Clostridium tyrobutyricum]